MIRGGGLIFGPACIGSSIKCPCRGKYRQAMGILGCCLIWLHFRVLHVKVRPFNLAFFILPNWSAICRFVVFTSRKWSEMFLFFPGTMYLMLHPLLRSGILGYEFSTRHFQHSSARLPWSATRVVVTTFNNIVWASVSGRDGIRRKAEHQQQVFCDGY